MAKRDYKQAYALAKFVIIAIPTNYDIAKNYFDTSSVVERPFLSFSCDELFSIV